jgi:carbon monoxide dehydrogenase subunit G
MAYASFRCRVNAPLATVWQRLKDKVQAPARAGAVLAQTRGLREEIEVDSRNNQIVVRLMSGQNIQGERRFMLKEHFGREQHEALLDAVLNWQTTSEELDRELMKAAVEVMVRDFALEIKREVEVAKAV